MAKAKQILLDTTNFDGVLSGDDTEVQKAMETLDALEVGNRAYFHAHRRTAFDMPASNTWYDYPWSLPATVKVNCTHDHASDPEEITLDKAGTYLISCEVTFKPAGDTNCSMRLLDDGAEVFGSYRQGVMHLDWRMTLPMTVVCVVGAFSVLKVQVSAANNGTDIVAPAEGAVPESRSAASISIARIGP